MTTIKELSEQLGVSPQTIRRYVKNELGVATQPRKMLQLDANQASAVAAHFSGKTQESATQQCCNMLQHLMQKCCRKLQRFESV